MNYNNDQISNFSSILKDKIELFQATIKKQGKVFKLCIEEDVYVLADPYAIDRIVNNIIENAIHPKLLDADETLSVRNSINTGKLIKFFKKCFNYFGKKNGLSSRYVEFGEEIGSF